MKRLALQTALFVNWQKKQTICFPFFSNLLTTKHQTSATLGKRFHLFLNQNILQYLKLFGPPSCTQKLYNSKQTCPICIHIHNSIHIPRVYNNGWTAILNQPSHGGNLGWLPYMRYHFLHHETRHLRGIFPSKLAQDCITTRMFTWGTQKWDPNIVLGDLGIGALRVLRPPKKTLQISPCNDWNISLWDWEDWKIQVSWYVDHSQSMSKWNLPWHPRPRA